MYLLCHVVVLRVICKMSMQSKGKFLGYYKLNILYSDNYVGRLTQYHIPASLN